MAYLAVAISSALVLVIVIYTPFWQGFKTFSSLLSQDTRYMASFATMLADVSSGKVTLNQAKLLGRVLFGIIYIYTLSLSRKRLSDMLRACFIAFFFFTALAVSNFEIWYAIWPMMLAILLSSRAVSLSMFVFAYGVSLSMTNYVFLGAWIGFTDSNYALINNLAYLMDFMPAILILFCFALQQMLSVNSKKGKSRAMAEGLASEPAVVKERVSNSANTATNVPLEETTTISPKASDNERGLFP
jgi:hypothetical protein